MPHADWEREYHVARIVSGELTLRVNGKTYYLRNPERRQKFRANEVYREAREEAALDGVLTQEELADVLTSRGVWTAKEEGEYTLLKEKIEEMKITLFEAAYRSNIRFTVRHGLAIAKKEIKRLHELKHKHDFATCDGIAEQAKFRYLVGVSLYRSDNTPYWAGEPGWDQADPVLDQAIDASLRVRLEESSYREISRTEPWIGVYGMRERCGRGVFDVAAVDLTDEQRVLLLWSGLYDSIQQHPDCPDDGVLDDDDMTDGWLISQRRKREANRLKKQADEISNPKIREADEVFLMADTVEDARRIEKLNDASASLVKSQRMSHLHKQGEVNEMHMPDTWQRFLMAAAQAENKAIRGK